MFVSSAPNEANMVLLNIAQMYSEIYKFDKAKEVYKRILYSPNGISTEMAVRVYLYLSELEDNNMDVVSSLMYIKMALTTAEKLSNPALLSECYFKYALLLDDSNDTDMAMKYYLRCVQTSNNPNENMYLASSYSNLAVISSDSKNLSAAKMYYELAISADEVLNNYEGLYFSYFKLSNIYKKEDKQKSYNYLVKAISAAKKLDDTSYLVTAYIELGDYYLYSGDYKQSLKSYILAMKVAPQQSVEDVQIQTEESINKIKMLVGEDEFSRIMFELKNKK